MFIYKRFSSAKQMTVLDYYLKIMNEYFMSHISKNKM